ncbi:hypothetical protein [Kribbella rubisoli]|uniref:hypothetical protein n=1 Tax=Kribbella rubisoli TaxID=3075929 RepID=UPI0018E4F031|nr:hypothetical protein [Kribbella rubisoli]
MAARASAAEAAGVGREGVSSDAQSSAARRTDQVPAVSPRPVRSVGSGVSERRAARRARVGGSGSAPAIGCSTHDGVPAGVRVGSPEVASSGAV